MEAIIALDKQYITTMIQNCGYDACAGSMKLLLLLVFSGFVLGCKPRRTPLMISLVLLVLPFVTMALKVPVWSVIWSISHAVVNFVMAKLTFPRARLICLLFIDAFVDGTASILYGLIAPGIQTVPLFLESLLTGGMVVFWCLIFLTPLRFRLRSFMLNTPTGIMVVSCLLLWFMYYVNLFSNSNGVYYEYMMKSYLESYYYGAVMGLGEAPEGLYEWVMGMEDGIYDFSMKICLALMQIILCAVLPVYMIVYSANSRLKSKSVELERQMQVQAEHYIRLAEANGEARRFRHDFKNTRYAMEKLLREGRNKEALALMRDFSEMLETPGTQAVCFETGNGIADALLTDKLRRAQAADTELSFLGAIPGNALAPADLCVLLGNTVDNAIEACEGLPQGICRKIEVECNCSSGFLFLTVRNPVDKVPEIVDNRIATSKSDAARHGFGIQSLHSIAQRYDGTIKLTVEQGIFTAAIDLCLPCVQAEV